VKAWWIVLAACSTAPRPSIAPVEPPAIELVESQPIETTLDSDLPDAYVVWPEMIASAKQSLDFAEFYAANAPASRLEPIVAAIEAAIQRGVKVRFLAEISMVREYSDTLDRLQKAGAVVRTLDLSTSTKGILHAKYFVVDGRAAYLGSQNFDWRSIEHIEELGARTADPAIVRGLSSIFAFDWANAGHEPAPTDVVDAGALVASPKDLLPAGIRWDLPELVHAIESAKHTIRMQAMTYLGWPELEQPLLDAAARGVKISLLVADWSKREKTIGGLQKLARVPNIEIRLVTIPQAAQGFIPFARVIHAKLLVADRSVAWVGTSNFEREYFYASRNVGLVIRDAKLIDRLARWSDATWSSPYAVRVDPDAKYEAPKIKD